MRKKKVKDFISFKKDPDPYRTIKTTLKSVIKNPDLIPKVEKLVTEINDLAIHSYQFIRLYLLKLYNDNQPLPTINETFVKYCIKTLGIKDTRGAKSQQQDLLKMLNDFYESEYKPLLNHQKTILTNKSQIVAYLSIQIFTCLEVNIKEHFVQHLLRFINLTTTEITKDKAILYKFKSCILNVTDSDEIFKNWVSKYLKHILPPRTIEKSVNYDCTVRPFDYLKCLLYMNSVIENLEPIIYENVKKIHKKTRIFKNPKNPKNPKKHNKESSGPSGPRLFQPLPLRTNIVPKHVLIDSVSVVKLFYPNVKERTHLALNITQNQDLIWSSILNKESKIFKKIKGYQFHNQINTDGISCSLLFIRKDLVGSTRGLKTIKDPVTESNQDTKQKIEPCESQEFYNIEDIPKEQLESLKDRNIIGCDPGKRSLVYMIDSKGHKLQYTSPQRAIETKSKRNKRVLLIEKNKHGIIKLETKLSEYNSKTVDYQKFKDYLVAKQYLNDKTKQFYQRDTWRKMAFRKYCYSQKSIDRFLNKIKDTYDSDGTKGIIIGYGNWSRSSQMKYHEPTMNKGLRKLIHKRYDTVTINEYNTSKKCCGCHKNLEHHKDHNGTEIYRLLKCSDCVSSENKKIVFRTRDVNSAVNILDITKLWILEQRRLHVFCYVVNDNPSITDSQKVSEKDTTIGGLSSTLLIQDKILK